VTEREWIINRLHYTANVAHAELDWWERNTTDASEIRYRRVWLAQLQQWRNELLRERGEL
jgi:hypothetical protein